MDSMDAGLLPVSPVPNLAALGSEERVEGMVAWFFENFEAPDRGEIPYDNEEGRYHFLWGGPYSARDELFDAFGDTVSQEEIQDAWEELEVQWTEWSPAAHRIIPPQDDDATDASLDQKVAALSGQIAVIETVLSRLMALSLDAANTKAGIGHNQPPPGFELFPTRDDLLRMGESLDALKAQLAQAEPISSADPVQLKKAAGWLTWLRGKLLGLLGAAAAGVAGGLGKFTFDRVAENPAVFHLLDSMTTTLVHWVQALTAAV